jgi:excisionase family DNA binding protein
VAARLGVCRATVYDLCARGVLRSVRVGNAIRIPPLWLEQFIAERSKYTRA